MVDGLSAQIIEVLKEMRGVREKLGTLQGPAFKAINDVATAQLAALIPPGFPLDVPPLLWPHLSKYLKALARRLEKVAGNTKRDVELANRVAPFLKGFNELNRASQGQAVRAELDKLQWMIEEFRVSLFAQDLRTATPVSEKRLADQLELARAEARRV